MESTPPTLLVNDHDPHLYPQNLHHESEPKRLLVRVVKAVKLHSTSSDRSSSFSIPYYCSLDVENPYCILEINHPKQVQQTSIANNGVNPYVKSTLTFAFPKLIVLGFGMNVFSSNVMRKVIKSIYKLSIEKHRIKDKQTIIVRRSILAQSH